MKQDLPWLPFEIEILSTGWKRGDLISKITEALPGRSKIAVKRKAHYLGLPPRPSPIIRKAS